MGEKYLLTKASKFGVNGEFYRDRYLPWNLYLVFVPLWVIELQMGHATIMQWGICFSRKTYSIWYRWEDNFI